MKIVTVERRLRTGEVVTLRSPGAGDAAPVLAFIRALSREASRNLNHGPEHFDAMTEDAEASFLDAMATHPRNVFIAASAGVDVIGTTSYTVSTVAVSRHCGELGLGVLASHRQKGVGRLLLEALVQSAEAAGVWNLLLRVRTFNAPAIALYESLGFRRVGVLRRVAALPEGLADEYLYQREGPSSP